MIALLSRAALRITEHRQVKTKKLILAKALPMLGVFAEWMRSQPQYAAQTPVDATLSAADAEDIRSENRLRSSMRTCLSALAELLEETVRSSNKTLLQEFIELRGFPPLQPGLERHFGECKTLEEALKVVVPEKDLLAARVENFKAFLRDLSAVAETERARSLKTQGPRSPALPYAGEDKLARENGIQKAPKTKRVPVETPVAPEGSTRPEPVGLPSEQEPQTQPVATSFNMWGSEGLGTPLTAATVPPLSIPSNEEFDEDDLDDVIVFRPAFSRVISPGVPAGNMFGVPDLKMDVDFGFDMGMRSATSMTSLASADFSDRDTMDSKFFGGLISTRPSSASPDIFGRSNQHGPFTVAAPPGFTNMPPPPGFSASASPLTGLQSNQAFSTLFQYPSPDEQGGSNKGVW